MDAHASLLEHTTEFGVAFDGKINAWDTSYFNNMVQKQFYNVDHEEIKLYVALCK